jgi:two-component system, cell cycle sensor histidine kinase and response regulator CckA
MGRASQRVVEFRRPSLVPPRRRVLCVDDDPAIGRLLTRWLGRRGYQVVPTTDPEEAVEQLINAPTPFDALITDQSMPRMTGLELSRFAVSGRPRLVVFLATALEDRLRPDELARSGVTHLVPKPFDLPEVARALDEALGPAQRPERAGGTR